MNLIFNDNGKTNTKSRESTGERLRLVLGLLEQAGAPLSASNITEALGWDKGKTHQVLYVLHKAGHIGRAGERGTYHYAPKISDSDMSGTTNGKKVIPDERTEPADGSERFFAREDLRKIRADVASIAKAIWAMTAAVDGLARDFRKRLDEHEALIRIRAIVAEKEEP